MYWANFLHIYQPPDQTPDILERVVNESYRALIKGLTANARAKLTLNINGCLTELLAKKGYGDVIRELKRLAGQGQIEFTSSAKYHAFLPKLPTKEIIRQIRLNDQTNKKYFGEFYHPQGFFSPEMAYSKPVARIVKELGFKWLLIDEIGLNGGKSLADFSKIYHLKGAEDFYIYFKTERASNLIAGAVVRQVPSFLKELAEDYQDKKYLITAMDGETFGHHRPGLEEFLFAIYRSKKFRSIFVSEISNYFHKKEPADPVPSTWSCNREDITKGLPYKLWYQPDNPLQKKQWQFVYWAIRNIENKKYPAKNYLKARRSLDAALNSCHFWWASKYWWSLEIIEQGAFNLMQTVKQTGSAKLIAQAKKLYQQILNLAFGWQRDGTIREFHKQQEKWQKVPLKQRTTAEWFNQLILEFADEMKKSAQNQEYEKAIKWRDAAIKLKNGADVYDALHVVNELGRIRRIPSVKPFAKHRRFAKFALSHFLPHPHLIKLTRKNDQFKKRG